MNLRSGLAFAGLLVAAVGFAQTAAVTPAPPPDTQKKTVPASPTSSAKAPAAKATAPAAKTVPAPKKEEEIPPIEGIVSTRSDGKLLGLKVVGGNFVLTFYDAKHKKIPADMQRATLRWAVKYQPAEERAVLNPGGEPTSLTSPKVIRPPLMFKVFMALFPTPDSETAAETYTVDYHE